MPTDVIKTIAATSSPTTPDYTTLQAWEDACPANLVTDDKRWIGECLDQGAFSHSGNFAAPALTISGQTTDSTRYVYLRCATGASFKDKAGVRTTALFFSTSNGVAISSTATNSEVITVSTANTRIEGMQIKSTGTSCVGIGGSSVSPTIRQCLLEAAGQPLSGTVVIHNSLVIAVTASGVIWSGNFRSLTAHGCTFVSDGADGGTAIATTNDTSLVKNCAIFGFSATHSGSMSGSSGYNATDLGSAPGSNNQTSLTYANQFESSTNDYRAKSSGGLQNGTPDTTNLSTDITGLARNATTPWIGCWEVSAAGIVSKILLLNQAVKTASYW